VTLRGDCLSAVNSAAEFLLVANNPEHSESGGGHGAKGVDFQRWWAVLRMVQLEQASEPDFLLLFESVQDVAELDSSTAPTRARVYQVKKKDSGTWSWSVLTGTRTPKLPSKTSKAASTTTKTPTFQKVAESTLGKLYFSLSAFNALPVEGVFLSNAGCDFPLANGGSAATTLPCSLADLAPVHTQLLTDAFASLSTGGAAPDLSQIKLQKVAIHPDHLNAPAIAAALELLNERSPEHASQAAAFVDSLLMKISSLGRHTDTCATFEDLVKERGFSRSAFTAALASLQTVPDRLELLGIWLKQLQDEGMDFRTVTAIRVAATRVQRERLVGGTDMFHEIEKFCDDWAEAHSWTTTLRPHMEAALTALKAQFSGYRDDDLMARYALRAITKCVDQN